MISGPLSLPKGDLLEEGAEQNEERKNKWGEGEGRQANYVFVNDCRCGRRPLKVQCSSSTMPAFGKNLNSIVGVVDDDHWS